MSIISKDINNIILQSDLDFLSGKDILITGASGLVGGYIAQTIQYFRQGGEIQSKFILSSKSGQFNFKLETGTELVIADITDPNFFSHLPKFDIIIHAAGYAQPDKFLENPIKTLALNTFTTLELSKKVKQGGKFLFLSSSEVYSGLSSTPYSENKIGTTNTNHPRSCYIEGKRSGEAIVSSARKFWGIDAKSARLSLAYGPGTKKGDTRVMNSFINQAIKNSKIVLKDRGTAMRTYCYISDAIELCLKILEKGDEDIYNVGGTSRVSIIELANLIAALTDSKVELPHRDFEENEGAPDDVWLDMQKTLELTGNRKFTPLEIGLQNTINWQRSNL
jgi:nucleoside-diphosphate-sugar epimerase